MYEARATDNPVCSVSLRQSFTGLHRLPKARSVYGREMPKIDGDGGNEAETAFLSKGHFALRFLRFLIAG